jgi:hypothetical protein
LDVLRECLFEKRGVSEAEIVVGGKVPEITGVLQLNDGALSGGKPAQGSSKAGGVQLLQFILRVSHPLSLYFPEFRKALV